MIEVFKTDVTLRGQAMTILSQLNKAFPHYQANFDLDDCDRILRIQSNTKIKNEAIIALLKAIDVKAEVLSDEVEAFDINELFVEKIN